MQDAQDDALIAAVRRATSAEPEVTTGSLFNTGIIPAVNEYLLKKSNEERNYGDYWSASSAGYCMRLNIMRRLGVPKVPELEDNATQTRIFEAGHIFHEWLQRITKDAGLSIASEVELQDEELMIRGHFDDLVMVESGRFKLDKPVAFTENVVLGKDDEGAFAENEDGRVSAQPVKQLILYDYKTAHSASFNYKKRQTEIGHYHKMQLGTYMMMLRKTPRKRVVTKDGAFVNSWSPPENGTLTEANMPVDMSSLNEARILSISKDDLRMHEQQLLWSPQLEKEVVGYWRTLNGYWKARKLPRCTCLDYDGGFMGKRSKKGKLYNDYFYNDTPCSEEWLKITKKKGLWGNDH